MRSFMGFPLRINASSIFRRFQYRPLNIYYFNFANNAVCGFGLAKVERKNWPVVWRLSNAHRCLKERQLGKVHGRLQVSEWGTCSYIIWRHRQPGGKQHIPTPVAAMTFDPSRSWYQFIDPEGWEARLALDASNARTLNAAPWNRELDATYQTTSTTIYRHSELCCR
jgi:hypothetical protein